MGEEGFFRAKRAKEVKENPAADVFARVGGGFISSGPYTIDSNGIRSSRYISTSTTQPDMVQLMSKYNKTWANPATITGTINIPRQSGKSYYVDYLRQMSGVDGKRKEEYVHKLALALQKNPRLNKLKIKGGEWNYEPQRDIFHFSPPKSSFGETFSVSMQVIDDIVKDLSPTTGPKQKPFKVF